MTAFALVPLAGCSKGGGGEASNPSTEEHQHILQMASVYRYYLAAHEGKPPASTDALKEWAVKEGKDKLKIKDAVEDALKSPRDGQPYAFVPPSRGRKMGPQPVIVYEQTGKSGKHLFAGEMANVGELTDKEVEDLKQAK
jgi:hypothetical protein